MNVTVMWGSDFHSNARNYGHIRSRTVKHLLFTSCFHSKGYGFANYSDVSKEIVTFIVPNYGMPCDFSSFQQIIS